MGTAARGPQEGARRLAGLVILGCVLYVVLDVAAQLMPPHYSPIRQAESDLAVGPYGIIMSINFLVRGGLALGLVLSLRALFPATGQPRAGFFFMSLWAACSALLAFFSTDILDASTPVPHIHVTAHGELHLVLALVAFIAAPIGALVLSSALRKSGLLPRVHGVAMPLAALSLVALIAMPVFDRAHAGGLGERIFLVLVLGWIFTVAFAIRGAAAPAEVAATLRA